MAKKTVRKSLYCNDPKAGKADRFRPCQTVGELKAALADVPDELPLGLNDGGIVPMWFNVGVSREDSPGGYECMSFERGDEYDDWQD